MLVVVDSIVGSVDLGVYSSNVVEPLCSTYSCAKCSWSFCGTFLAFGDNS